MRRGEYTEVVGVLTMEVVGARGRVRKDVVVYDIRVDLREYEFMDRSAPAIGKTAGIKSFLRLGI